jgi:hypothetical protein
MWIDAPRLTQEASDVCYMIGCARRVYAPHQIKSSAPPMATPLGWHVTQHTACLNVLRSVLTDTMVAGYEASAAARGGDGSAFGAPVGGSDEPDPVDRRFLGGRRRLRERDIVSVHRQVCSRAQRVTLDRPPLTSIHIKLRRPTSRHFTPRHSLASQHTTSHPTLAHRTPLHTHTACARRHRAGARAQHGRACAHHRPALHDP